jgi:hypothetical protein
MAPRRWTPQFMKPGNLLNREGENVNVGKIKAADHSQSQVQKNEQKNKVPFMDVFNWRIVVEQKCTYLLLLRIWHKFS